MSTIASTMITLIFGIPGFVIAGLISIYAIPFALHPFVVLNILTTDGVPYAAIACVIMLITALAGFYFGGIFGEWLSSKIW